MSDTAALIDSYFRWLRDRTVLRQVHNWTEITTPFVDRHNDLIQIYVKRHDDGLVLTDDGYTINDLESSGCSLDSPRRKEILQTILKGYGVKREENELLVRAMPENFALKKHNLIQTILSVNDLFYLARPNTFSIFMDDVAAWLDSVDVRYIPQVKLPGTSGFDHVFDFAIPKSRSAPERLLRALANPSRDSATSFSFAWLDTRDARQAGAEAIALLNDSERAVSAQVREALDAYGIRGVPWSERDSITQVLVA